MKKYLLLFTLLFFVATVSMAQNSKEKTKATFVSVSSTMKVVPSIASQIANGTFIPAVDIKKEYNPKRMDGNKAVPGKGLPIGNDPLLMDEALKTKNPSKTPIVSWDAGSGNSTPTDPTAAVGPNHLVNAWNSSFRIWDKEGNSLTNAASLSTIWPGETSGDPIVLYDKFADRFLITQLTFSSVLIAISQGPDPINDDWYTYEFPMASLPDYPKYSVWSDGYYLTSNIFSGSAGTSNVVFAIERDQVIAGAATVQIIGFPLTDITTSGFFSPLGFNCNGAELPPLGGAPIVYMQDDSWSGVSTDHLKVWTIDVDWVTPTNSTISDPQILDTEVFDGLFDGGSFSNLPQPAGSDIDALQATIMNLVQYRRFPDHNAAVLNFVVDLDNNDDHAGIRWFELRQDNDGDDWYIYQEGTHEQPDGHSAFSGSIAMDALGNIGLGYSVVSSTQKVSIRYTGRYESDPLGQMTLIEDTIGEGLQNDPSTRYGDYAQMTVDPTDDKTFWHIGEYFKSGTRKNVVGAFKLAPDFLVDAGINLINSPNDGTLSAAETITVSIRNFGVDSIWEVPVSFSVDGGTVYSETYMDTIPPSTTVMHSFATPVDMSTVGASYEITAYTALIGDEDNTNDTLSKVVIHLNPNDIGITAITSPVSASGLSNSEVLSISIENYGGAAQTDFDVSYVIDGGTPVTEVVAGPLDGPGSTTYNFNTTADLSALGSYEIVAYTSLPGDSDLSNDTSMTTVENSMCTPFTNCSFGDGLQLFQLTTIDNETSCSTDGYADYTNMVADLYPGSTNDLTVTTGYGNQYVKVWIDLNDNFVFENSELIIDDLLLGDGSGGGTFTETTDFTIDASAPLGEHLMRAKTNWNSGVPNDACEETSYGETEDYTANIDLSIGLEEGISEPNEMLINYLPNNQFEVSFTALNTDETLIITIHNTAGQKVIYNRVPNINGSYFYDFDMSYAAPGVYLVRLGSEKFGKVKKILVK